MMQNCDTQEYDVSDEVLNWYGQIYNVDGGLGTYFDLDNPHQVNGRACYRMKPNALFNKDAQLIELSGDIVFNISQKGPRGQSRYEVLHKYIKDISSPDLKEEYEKKLVYCKENNYSKKNCALLPKQGNLQNAKQGIGNDRGDTFIWALDMYYENQLEILLNHATYENIGILKSFLDCMKYSGRHESVYRYCEIFYNITDREFIEKIIASGAKAIDSEVRAREYIDLVMEFWKIRKEKVAKNIKGQAL